MSAEPPTYAILYGGRAIQCLACLAISYHPEDVAQRYCGNCHRFHEDQDVRHADPS